MLSNIKEYFSVLYGSLIGRTQKQLAWYDDRLERAMVHIELMYDQAATKTAKKAAVKKTAVKKAAKPSGK